MAGRVTVLRRMRRFGEDSAIAALAEAVRAGDADAALAMLAEGRSDVRWVRPDDADGVDQVLDEVAATGEDMVAAARRGDAAAAMAAAGRIKVLAATRRGHLGLDEWTDRIEAAVWPSGWTGPAGRSAVVRGPPGARHRQRPRQRRVQR